MIIERKKLMSSIAELEADNKALREAVAARLGSTDTVESTHRGYSPMAASLAGCKPAQEAAARCFDTTSKPAPADAADSDTPSIPEDWILRGHRELEGQRQRGDGILAATPDDDVSPAERMLLDAAAAVRDRRRRYGPPRDHFTITVGLINAAFGTSFRPEDWATIMQLDKIARSRGPSDHPDNNIDAAGYAACRAECRVP
jgi:hypothetical protein